MRKVIMGRGGDVESEDSVWEEMEEEEGTFD